MIIETKSRLNIGARLSRIWQVCQIGSAKRYKKAAGLRTCVAVLLALVLGLTLAQCDTRGGGGGGSAGGDGNGNGDKPTCTGNQILQNEQCEECTALQYPNADRTACVSTCPDGEIKLEDNPTCETIATCADDKTHNPADNTCIDFTCGANEAINTTTSELSCITKSQCLMDSGKVLSVNGESCIRESACTSVAGQVANTDGNCEACGEDSVINIEENACISIEECQTDSANRFSVLGNRCITDIACQDMAGHVATMDGNCEQCAGDDSIRNMEKTACMSAAACQSQSDNAFSVLDGADCITDAACVAEDGRVATTDGDCQTCTGTDSIRNMEKTACMSAAACQSLSSNAFSVLNEAECITDAACIAMEGHVAATDGVCQQCTGTNNVRNVDKRACITATACHAGNSSGPNSLLGSECITDEACLDMENHVAQHDGVCMACVAPKIPNAVIGMCDTDSDSDGVGDASDAFPADACASVDSDNDGVPNALLSDCYHDFES